jgi:hypothetical protein
MSSRPNKSDHTLATENISYTSTIHTIWAFIILTRLILSSTVILSNTGHISQFIFGEYLEIMDRSVQVSIQRLASTNTNYNTSSS